MGQISSTARLTVESQQAPLRADSLQLTGSVGPMSGASMRILERTIAVAAILTAVLIGLGR